MQRSGQASILMKVCHQKEVQRLETELRAGWMVIALVKWSRFIGLLLGSVSWD